MFVVLFEVHPAPGKKDEYLTLAKQLKPLLEAIEGFVDNERFESASRDGWVLSLSTWRDEKALVRWRTQGEHHQVQKQGRGGVFADYHLRVCDVVADSTPPAGMAVIEQRLDTTLIGAAKAVTVTEIPPAAAGSSALDPAALADQIGRARPDGHLAHELFTSIVTPGKLLLLVSWDSMACAARWDVRTLLGGRALRHRRLRNIRDYGLEDRREAPQFFPAPHFAGGGH